MHDIISSQLPDLSAPKAASFPEAASTAPASEVASGEAPVVASVAGGVDGTFRDQKAGAADGAADGAARGTEPALPCTSVEGGFGPSSRGTLSDSRGVQAGSRRPPPNQAEQQQQQQQHPPSHAEASVVMGGGAGPPDEGSVDTHQLTGGAGHLKRLLLQAPGKLVALLWLRSNPRSTSQEDGGGGEVDGDGDEAASAARGADEGGRELQAVLLQLLRPPALTIREPVSVGQSAVDVAGEHDVRGGSRGGVFPVSASTVGPSNLASCNPDAKPPGSPQPSSTVGPSSSSSSALVLADVSHSRENRVLAQALKVW